ncbi:single-stranded DNA-binding protein [Microbacteriaceae bacterium 4G12]
MNRAVLIGRLTRDPELYYTKEGMAYAKICVAVQRGFRSNTGERQADFIDCVVWRNSAENVALYCKKGALIGVTGRIHTSQYTNKEGKRIYRTEVAVEALTFLERKKEEAPQ